MTFYTIRSRLSWEPDDAECPPTSYVIEIQTLLVDMCRESDDVISFDVVQNSADLKDLYPDGITPFSSFVVNVTARNFLGDSNPMSISIESDESG